MGLKKEEYKRIKDVSANLQLPDFDEQSAWEKVDYLTSSKKRMLISGNKLLKYAAVILLGLTIGFMVSKIDFFDSNDKYVEINASKGQKIDIKLPDGNKIWVNSNTSIRYPANFEEFNKRIYVQGEAYFEFPAEALNPVFVIVNDVIIQGFDASFNVKVRENLMNAEVTVTRGWVAITNTKGNINDYIVDEGYTAFFSEELPLFVQESQNRNFLAWKTGELNFEETPLITVIETLSDYYEIPMRIDGKVKYCKFTSNYKDADLNTILEDVELLFKPQIDKKSSEINIKGDDC